MARHTRYQGAILRDGHILLIKHRQHSTGREYWVIPGGGIGDDESEEECVVREMKEETHLDVKVEGLILEESAHPESPYTVRKTYLCRPIAGTANPGHEPEPEAAADYAIVEVGWFDLRAEDDWDAMLKQDPFTYPQLKRLRELLGYEP
ncbi:MAG: NUDIX domain-containing protein [Anaerolineales bacterium]|nr:NUDIX domain-containing protein [Anaerolineales bacterium]